MSILDQNLDKLEGYYVIFPYGLNKYRGKLVDVETKKKFEFDLWKNHESGISRPEMIMKNTIIYLTKDKDEAIKVLDELNKKGKVINELIRDLIDTVREYEKKAVVND